MAKLREQFLQDHPEAFRDIVGLAWLAENFAYKYILGKLTEAAKIRLDDVHNEIKKHNPLRVDDENLEANFKLESWDVKDAQVGDGFIRVEATAQGTPTIRIK